MADSSVGTTSQLSAGARMTVRQFSDTAARSVSESIARNTYRRLLMSDTKVQKMREYIYKMVSGWVLPEKIRLLQEYGSFDGKTNEEYVNKRLVETLIIHMKQEDQEILLKDLQNEERQIVKEVQEIRREQKKAKQKSSFSTASFNAVYNKLKDEKNPRKLQSRLKNIDKGFKIPRYITNAYPQLKTELFDILKNIYNRVTIAQLAYRMGIEIEETMKFKTIATNIINKTLLYVDLIIGKSKSSFAGAILDSEPFNEILIYTSFAHVTGKPGLSPSKLKALKDEAREAKIRAIETFKIKRQGFKLKRPSTWLPSILRGLTKTTDKNMKIVNDLATQDPEQLNELGKHLGITREEFKDFNLFKEAIAKQLSVQDNRIKRRKRIIARKEARGDDTTQDYRSLKGMQDLSSSGLYEVEDSYGTSNNVPFILLNKDIIFENIKKAVPVFIVNSYFRKLNEPVHESNKERIERETKEKKQEYIDQIFPQKNIPTSTTSSLAPSSTEASLSTPSSIQPTLVAPITSPLSNKFSKWFDDTKARVESSEGQKDLTDLEKTLETRRKNAKVIGKTGMLGSTGMKISGSSTKPYNMRIRSDLFPNYAGSPKDPFVALVDRPTQALSDKGTYALRVFDVSSIIMAKNSERMEKMRGDSKEPGLDFFSSSSKTLGVKHLRTEPAIPVFVVNKSVSTDAGNILLGVVKLLGKVLNFFLPGMGNLATNMITEMAAGNDADDLVSMALKMTGFSRGGKAKASKSLPKFAKGTTGTGASSISQFITGDSTTNKPNEEKVSIDWQKKSFEVQPVAKAKQATLQQAGISSVSKLKDSTAPLQVITINNNLAELVEVGGTKTSMINLVFDMAQRLQAIESLLSIGNTQRAAVISTNSVIAKNASRQQGGSSPNPFLGGSFPTSLNTILQGE